jgi:hypothetical protein
LNWQFSRSLFILANIEIHLKLSQFLNPSSNWKSQAIHHVKRAINPYPIPASRLNFIANTPNPHQNKFKI